MLSKLQSEHATWVDREFPNQPAYLPAIGMVEEAGELCHALLKLQQLMLYGADRRYSPAELHADFVDAIGDCAIYACSYCNATSYDFVCLLPYEKQEATPLALSVQLVHAAASFAEDHEHKHLYRYMAILQSICDMSQINFAQAVLTTWASVKQRKRIK